MSKEKRFLVAFSLFFVVDVYLDRSFKASGKYH